jgi:hypothetical protein
VVLIVKDGQAHGWIIYIMKDEKNKTHLNGYIWMVLIFMALFVYWYHAVPEECFDIMVCIC